ncbi:MAG: hypothetical protein HZB49_18275, partial [Bradyrhizobium sp.]|nr:hypothetical protein [Bradyrhizobium sp.]
PTGRLRHFTNKIDLSYGIYIFGWPITQTLILLYPGLDVISLVILSLALAATIALPSWLWIERPALRSRDAAMALLESGLEAAWWWRRLPSAETAVDGGKTQ